MAGTKTAAVWEILEQIGISLGMDVAFKELTKAGANHIKEKVVTDKRGELLADLAGMNSGDTGNLVRRHRESIRHFRENRFVTLLCKIPKEGDQGRKATLKYLNGLGDEEFEQMLNLLENDVVWQWMHRAWLVGAPVTRQSVDALRWTLREGTEEYVPAATRQLESAGDGLAPLVDGLAGWLRRHGGRR